MFIFAHIFLGALIGLGFWHLTGDRRVIPLCILGAALPDLLDKPLAFLFPEVLGSGRTIGHTLLFAGVITVTGVLLWHYRHTLLGLACACAVFSHQILDSMWTLLPVWCYPLVGPFSVSIIPDYAGHFFWLEITSPSEWTFAGAAILLSGLWYLDLPEYCGTHLSARTRNSAQILFACLLGAMGVSMLLSGLAVFPSVWFAPTYNPETDVMAGLVALCGSIVLFSWPRAGSGS
jgi:hypothetical protein